MQLESYFDFLSPDDIRIKGHRIGIDNVLELFLNGGYSAESIAEYYPELGLEKIYATLTYYYRQKSEVDAYLERLRNWREERYQEAQKNLSPFAIRLRELKAQRSGSSAR